MGKLSTYKLKKVLLRKNECMFLYRKGLSTREIGKLLNMPFGTVARYVRELSTTKGVDTK